MLINIKVKIYVVVFEANTNSSNIPQGCSQYYDCHKTIGLGGGGGAKPFVNNQSSNNVVKLLDWNGLGGSWALCSYLHCLNLS
jgi:hypothetical protein